MQKNISEVPKYKAIKVKENKQLVKNKFQSNKSPMKK